MTATRTAWIALIILAATNAINYTDRMSLAVLLEPIKHDLRLSDSELGAVTGLAFSLFYALLGIPIARYADRGNRMRLVALAMVIWSAMTALVGGARNFGQMFAARVGVGAGEAGCIPASHSLIADLFPRGRRALAMSVFNCGGLVGLITGLGATGWLAQNYGWRATLEVLAGPGIVLAAISWLVLREPPRGSFDGGGIASPLPFRDALRGLASRRSYVRIVLASAACAFTSIGATQWTPVFMMRSHHMSLTQLGFAYALSNGVASVGGMLLGGWLSDRMRHHDERWILWGGAVAFLFSWPLTAASFLVRDTAPMLALFALTAVISNIPSGPMVAFVQSVNHPRARAMAAAFAAFTVSLIGFGAGPVAIGVISDRLTKNLGSAAALRDALVATSFTYVIGAALLLLAATNLRADLSAVPAGK